MLDINECLVNNGGCEQQCVNTRGSFICACTSGFRIAADGQSCLDQDECGNNSCQQRCINTAGSFFCACEDGYTLNDDNVTCTGKFFLFILMCYNYV